MVKEILIIDHRSKKYTEDKEEQINKILANLNPAQKEAVISTEGQYLIIAGAGSGKTRVLTHRLAYLLAKGVEPSAILALTFTNKAANEMKERIAQLTSPDIVRQVWAGTFHSLFARILRIEAHHIGYTSTFSIYDNEDSISLVKKILNDKYPNEKIYPQSVYNTISWAKNQLIDYQEFYRLSDTQLKKKYAELYALYQQELKNNNAMDFDDLLINLIVLFEKYPEILEKYRKKFKYILVDEYQDTNIAQYKIIKMLASENGNICVVGDDAQSIYRWRGAEIQNIFDFQVDYPNHKLLRLEQNYRSTKSIIEAANSVIKKNNIKIPKNLWTNNDQGELIEIIECDDDYDEARKIINIIREKILTRNWKYSDFAVLYRTNAQAMALETVFRRELIPYITIGSLSFFKRKEIKDILAYLKLLVNPRDNTALYRIYNEPPRGIGPVSIAHLTNYAVNNRITLLEAFAQADKIPELTPSAQKTAKEFAINIYETAQKINEPNSHDLLWEYYTWTGLEEMYKEIDTPDAVDRINNMNQLMSGIVQFLKENQDAHLSDYLQSISLLSDIDNAQLNNDQVKLMTLHSSKGLEFPCVFISGLEEGLFPLESSTKNIEELEEERRLFYVGMTRAKEKLYLTYAVRRNKYGSEILCSPSKFIREIDPKYIHSNNINNSKPKSNKSDVIFYDIPKKEFYSQVDDFEDNKVSNNFFNFKVGDKVLHPIFGKGKIEELDGFGVDKYAVVRFEQVGKKKLMLRFAKLRKIKDD